MSTLGNNIKSLRKKNKMNQQQLAKSLGVSQTSVAHYEAGSRQPNIETLMELSILFGTSIDKLVGNSELQSKKTRSRKYNKEELVNLLVTSLVDKDEDQFLEVFQKHVLPHHTLQDVIDQFLKKVLYEIGHLWEVGTLSEADEHYATNIVRKAVNYISVKMESGLKSKKAITFVSGSEKHTLGMEMVNTYLESKGVELIYLGGDLPIRTIKKMIEDHNPDYIFISVTMQDNFNSLVHLVEFLQKENKNIKICIGGQGVLQSEATFMLGEVFILRDIEDVRKFLETQ